MQLRAASEQAFCDNVNISPEAHITPHAELLQSLGSGGMAQVKLARHILTNELVRFTVLMSMMDCFRTIVVDAPRQPAPHSLAHAHFTAHSHPYATRQVAIKIINKARLSDVVSVISMLD